MSNIVGARVDERLIHGQVATAWTNGLQATRIMVIDDEIVKSAIDKQMLKMACPASCKLSILRLESAISNLQSEKYGQDRIFIVTKYPVIYLRLLEAGICLDEVVVGNMAAHGDGAVMLRRSVYVTRAEVDDLAAIERLGVRVVLRQTPQDAGESFTELIASKGGQLWD